MRAAAHQQPLLCFVMRRGATMRFTALHSRSIELKWRLKSFQMLVRGRSQPPEGA